jgi:hypothetical protein
MIAYDTLVGEFRVHYAGFFDPGFGHPAAGGEGSRAVLEVRSYEVPFVIEHGQVVGRLTYERLTAQPSKLYGSGSQVFLPAPGNCAQQAFKVRQGLRRAAAAANASPQWWACSRRSFGLVRVARSCLHELDLRHNSG